jgi:hypothetical protein
MTDLATIAEAFGPLVGNAIEAIANGQLERASGILKTEGFPVHWSPSLEPALDRVMAEDSLLTRVLAALVGVCGHHRGTTAKDVARAVEIIDAEIARRESEAA